MAGGSAVANGPDAQPDSVPGTERALPVEGAELRGGAGTLGEFGQQIHDFA